MPSPTFAFAASGQPDRLPVLLSVPHAGRAYSPALLSAARVGASALAVLEDPLVDKLISRTVAAGATAVIAQAPRAEIDLNRSLDDLDPAMISPPLSARPISRRAGSGLGLIPSRLAGHGAIWRGCLAASEAERRIAEVYHPYHRAIAERLVALRSEFGVAVLIDCHSMPAGAARRPVIVLGDRHGATIGDDLLRAAEAVCSEHGVPTIRNDPYAGGEIVARHGRPAEHIHAVQIEIDRRLYLAADMCTPGPGFGRIAALVADLAERMARAATPMLLAAE